jgi:hypothetical protein
MKRTDARSDEGAILLLVLGFLAFFGIVAVALLAQSGSSLKSGNAVQTFGKKVYSADSGIDFGIEALRTDATLCPDDKAPETTITTSLVVDNQVAPVTVKCRTSTAGSSGGWRGFGIITTSTDADSLQLKSGPDKTISGAVFVNGGITGAKDLKVENANYYQSSTRPCSGKATATPAPPYGKICSASLPVLDATPPAPAGPTNPAPDTTTRPGCTIFRPGTYTTQPALGNNNYFKSGVYYFNDVGAWTIEKATVVGGTRGGETSELTLPCYDEPTPNGDGVEFVLQGTSRMIVGNKGKVELFSRRPTAPDGTPGTSLFVVGSPPGGSALDQTNGNPQAVFHGAVYAKDAEVGTNAVGGVSFWMLNGVVASKLLLQSSGDGLKVSTEGGASSRTVVLTSEVPVGSGERLVKATAVLSIATDRTVTVLSRRSE